ncbi:MAG: hypothetical protein ACXADC_17075 [Candidatus Thorarchaeota archaeon]|jgi:hypothetical protein
MSRRALKQITSGKHTDRQITQDKEISEAILLLDELSIGDDNTAKWLRDCLKIYFALCTGSMTTAQARDAFKIHTENPAASVLDYNPLKRSREKRGVSRLIRNIKILKRLNNVTGDYLQSAILDSFVRDYLGPTGRDYDLICYFFQHPMASYTEAAKHLGWHRSTVSTALARCQESYYTSTYSLVDNGVFGLRSFMLIFSLAHGLDWRKVREGLLEFPFIVNLEWNKGHQFKYASFLIPGCRQNLSAFQESIERLAESHFDYVSLHPSMSYGIFTNLSLLQDGLWVLPEGILKGNALDYDVALRMSSSRECRGPRMDMSLDDYRISTIYRRNLRLSSQELSDRCKSMGWDIDTKQAYYRSQKLLDGGILQPFFTWASLGKTYTHFVEVICGPKSKARILKILHGFPKTLFYESGQGLLLWIEVPPYHNLDYYTFITSLSRIRGVEDVKHVIFDQFTTSRSDARITEGLEYGKEGFSRSSYDVDISEYVSC